MKRECLYLNYPQILYYPKFLYYAQILCYPKILTRKLFKLAQSTGFVNCLSKLAHLCYR